MIGRLWLNKCQICHWRASSLLFMPNGCNVLALFIRWASRAFLTESRLLRMSLIGIRRTSLIEWLVKVKWYWCGCTELLVIQDRTSVFPKAFTELTFGLSDILKVTPFTFYQVYKIFNSAQPHQYHFTLTKLAILLTTSASSRSNLYIANVTQ